MLRAGIVLSAVIALGFSVMSPSPAFAASLSFSGTITGPDVSSAITIRAVNPNNNNTLSQVVVQPNQNGEAFQEAPFEVKNIRLSSYKIRVSSVIDGISRSWYLTNETPNTGSPRAADGKRFSSNQDNIAVRFGTIQGELSADDTQASLNPKVSVASGVVGTKSRQSIANEGRFLVNGLSSEGADKYKVTFLPYRNDYIVSFRDGGLNFQEDWYATGLQTPGGVEFSSSASRIALNAQSVTFGADFTYKRAYQITGQISGGPISLVTVDRHADPIKTSVAPSHAVKVYRLVDDPSSYQFHSRVPVAITQATSTHTYTIKGLRRGVRYVVQYAGNHGKSRFQSEYYCQSEPEEYSSEHTIEGTVCSTGSTYVGKYFENVRVSERQFIRVNDNSNTTSVQLQTVTLNTGGKISGRVTKTSGWPRSKIAVRAYSSSGYVSRFAYANSKGYFIIEGLTAGSYRVEVNPDGYIPRTSRKFYNGKRAGTTSSGSAKSVSVTTGTRNIGTIYFDPTW